MCVCMYMCAGVCVWGQHGPWSAVQSDCLAQPHVVVSPVKDAIMLLHEDNPQDRSLSLILQSGVAISWRMFKAELEALGFTSGLTITILSDDIIGAFG